MTMFNDKVSLDLIDKIGDKVIDLINSEAKTEGLNEQQILSLHMNFMARYLIALLETYIREEKRKYFLGLLQEYVKKTLQERKTNQNFYEKN